MRKLPQIRTKPVVSGRPYAPGMEKNALLVVDVQVDVMAESVNSDAVVSTIASLVERARAADVPVIWVRHSDAGLAKDTPGWHIVPDLIPAAGETIVEKTYGDSFVKTDLADVLTGLGATHIYLCGAQSDACIRQTFYGALHRGYDVTLISDAHTTADLRPYGAPMSPEQSIGMLNMHAAWTNQADVAGDVKEAKAVFG